MPADSKLVALESKVKFRSAAADMLTILEALCRPGQSVEDLAALIKESLTNDMLTDLLMEQIGALERRKAAEAQQQQGKRV